MICRRYNVAPPWIEAVIDKQRPQFCWLGTRKPTADWTASYTRWKKSQDCHSFVYGRLICSPSLCVDIWTMIVNKISAQVLESFFLLVIFVWETSCTVVVNTSQTQRRDQWTKNSSCCSWCVSDSHLLVLEWGARSRNFQIPECPVLKLRWMSWSSPRRCWWSQRAIARTAKRPSRFSTNTQRTHNISNQVLAKFKIDPEKFEIIEIDNRKDMDAIQAYMKKVITFDIFT